MPRFSDYPDFKPNLTPAQIFKLGSFGGTYWRPIYSHVTKKDYKNQHHKFPFLDDIPDEVMTVPYNEYDRTINKYGVKVGMTLRGWEKSGWITPHDPYGWVQWYCNFYDGRRIPDEDRRQIDRWKRIAGANGRFKLRLDNMIKKNKDSPAIRQTLQHWAVRY